tara:strand:+ start:2675 stop:3061 length:387 start_codon:yes stop_codon:yes gene_type:complete
MGHVEEWNERVHPSRIRAASRVKLLFDKKVFPVDFPLKLRHNIKTVAMKPLGDQEMNVELTDEEVTRVMVALDNYRNQNEEMWADTRDETAIEEAGSAEWLWQKLFAVQQEFRNSVADAIGEGEVSHD